MMKSSLRSPRPAPGLLLRALPPEDENHRPQADNRDQAAAAHDPFCRRGVMTFGRIVVETVHKDDVEKVIKLIYEFIIQLKAGHDFRYIK